MTGSTMRIGKLDAARRQLRTAITLWFNGGDPVSVHTLAVAAYEIIHTISEKRDPYRRDLLFDTLWIKDEYRREWINTIKKHANFFKHADRDGDSVIEFNPELSEGYIFFAIAGRELCGELASNEESIFMWWVMIHKAHILTENGHKTLANRIPIDAVEHLRTISKSEFFQALSVARANSVRGSFTRRHTLRLS